MSWKVIAESARGTSHLALDEPCQDATHSTPLLVGGEDIMVAACADGAGSALFSYDGAHTAAKAITLAVSESLSRGIKLSEVTESDVRSWFLAAQSEVILLAESLAHEPRQYASTLVLAVIGAHRAVFAQIGDGCSVFQSAGEIYVPIWPQSGEYANTTNFLTDEQLERKIEVRFEESQVEAFAILTDGLQQLALSFRDKKPHPGFFLPFFKMLSEAQFQDDLVVPLRRFLDSPAVNDRTDDDKTLVVAVRDGHEPTNV